MSVVCENQFEVLSGDTKYKICFGKYRGELLKEVYENDKGYCKWLRTHLKPETKHAKWILDTLEFYEKQEQ